MAATQAEITAIVNSIKELAKQAKILKSLTDQALAHNSAHSIDWNEFAQDYPDLVDESGDIVDAGITPAELSNAIGSLASYQTYWTTHGGNFEKLTKPIV